MTRTGLITEADGLTLAQLKVMYDLAREISAGEYPMSGMWAEDWLSSLPERLVAKLDAA